MFRDSKEYSEWDENGIPTVDVNGVAVSKNRHKRLVKQSEAQKKRHGKWLATERE